MNSRYDTVGDISFDFGVIHIASDRAFIVRLKYEPAIRHRGGEQDGVEDVEDAAETGDGVGRVFGPGVPLDQRFGEVTEYSGDPDGEAETDGEGGAIIGQPG